MSRSSGCAPLEVYVVAERSVNEALPNSAGSDVRFDRSELFCEAAL